MDAAASNSSQPGRPWLAALAVALIALLLLGENLLPGRALLPLLPGDFPAWAAGSADGSAPRHPQPNFCMSDVLHLLLPGLAVNARAFARSELPLWDDSQALGLPHLHQVHYGVLYPPAWLPTAFGLHGLLLMAWLHLVVAGGGMLLYLRAIGRSPPAALLGALAFMLSAWVTARLHSFPVVGAAVWLPAAAWALELAALASAGRAAAGPVEARRLLLRARRLRVFAAGCVGLSWLAGFPQVALLVTATLLWLELFRAFGARRARLPLLRPLAGNLLAIALGLAFALPQLLPTLEYRAQDSLRGDQTAAQVAAQGLEPRLLWHLLVPERYATAALTGGHPLALGDLEQARLPAALNRAETSLGIGVLGLLLALVAAVHGRNWRTRAASSAVVGVFVLLCWPAALQVAAELVPPLRQGNPKRLLLVSTFGLAVLAAGGLDLVRGRRISVTVLAWAAAVAATLAALVVRLSVPSTALPEDIQRWATGLAATLSAQTGTPLDAEGLLAVVPAGNFVLAARAAADSSLIALAVAGFALIVFRPRRRPGQEGWSTLARVRPHWLVGVAALELLLAAWPMLRAAPTAEATLAPGRLTALHEPPVAALVRSTQPDSVAPVRMARIGNDPSWLRPNFPGLFGLSDLQCYAPMAPRRVAELLATVDPAVILSGSTLGGFSGPEVLGHPLLDLLDVRAVLTERQDVATPELPLAGWVEQGRVGDLRVLRNEQALPRAFVVHELDVEADAERRLARLGAPDFDPRRVALLQAPLEGAWPAASAAATSVDRTPRAVRLHGWRAGRIAFTVAPGAPGLAVISEGWHPGWRASVNGRPVTALCANHALLAIPVESDQTAEVLLQFDPPLVKRALGAGAAAALLALLACVFPLRRRA